MITKNILDVSQTPRAGDLRVYSPSLTLKQLPFWNKLMDGIVVLQLSPMLLLLYGNLRKWIFLFSVMTKVAPDDPEQGGALYS